MVCKSDPLHQPLPTEMACKGDLLHQPVVGDATQLVTWVHILSVRLGIKQAAPVQCGSSRRSPRLRTRGVEESLRSEEQQLVLTAPPAPACTPLCPHLPCLFLNRQLLSVARAGRNTIVLVHRSWPTRSCASASRLQFKRQCRLQDAAESQVRMGLENTVSMQTAGSVRLPDDTGTCVASTHPFSTMRRPAARVAARHDLCLYSRVLAITNLGFGFTCCKVKYTMYKRAELGVSDVHRIGTPAPCEQQPLRRSMTSVVVAQRLCFSVRYCRDPMPLKRPEQHVHLGQTLSDMDVGLLEPLKVSAAAWRQGSGSSFEALRLRNPHVVDSKIFLAARPLPAAPPSILLCSPGVNRRAVTMGKIPVVTSYSYCCVTSRFAFSTMRPPAARIDACHDLCLYSRMLASTNLGFTYCKMKYKMYKWAELGGLDVHRMGRPAACQQRPVRRSVTSIVAVATSLRSSAVRSQAGVWSWPQKLATARRYCFSARHCRMQVLPNALGQHVYLQTTSPSDTDVGFLDGRKVFMVAWQWDSTGACTNARVDACQAACLYSRSTTASGMKVPQSQLEGVRVGRELNARCAATPATRQQRTFHRVVTFVVTHMTTSLFRSCLQQDHRLDSVVPPGASCNLNIVVAVRSRHLTTPDALRHCAVDEKSMISDCGVAASSSLGMFGGGTATSKAEECCRVMCTGRSRPTSRLACGPLQHCSRVFTINPLTTLRAHRLVGPWDKPTATAVESTPGRPRKHGTNEAAPFNRNRFPWQPTHATTISQSPRSSSRSHGRDEVNALFRDCLQDVMLGSHVDMEASWQECGLDSLSSIAFARRLSDTFDLSFDAATFFDFGSPALLAKSIWDRLHNLESCVSPNPASAHARTGAGQTWRNTDTRGCQLSPLNLQPKPGKVLYICPPFGFGRHGKSNEVLR